MLDNIRLRVKEKINPFSEEINLTDENNIEFVLDYSGAVNQKGFYPVYTWLLKSYKLQRLNQQGILDISFEFITGVNKSLPELERLILKRARAKEWSFEEWLELINNSYEFDDKQNKERLVLKLKDLWDTIPIKENPISYLEKIIKTAIEEDEN